MALAAGLELAEAAPFLVHRLYIQEQNGKHFDSHIAQIFLNHPPDHKKERGRLRRSFL